MSREGLPRDGSPIYNTLDGLTGALETKGVQKGPGEARTDAGVYLHYPVDYHVRLSQQRMTTYLGSFIAAVGGGYPLFEYILPHPTRFIDATVSLQSGADYVSTIFGGVVVYAVAPELLGQGPIRCPEMLAFWQRAYTPAPTMIATISGYNALWVAPTFVDRGRLLAAGYTIGAHGYAEGISAGAISVGVTIRDTEGRSEPF